MTHLLPYVRGDIEGLLTFSVYYLRIPYLLLIFAVY